jgi:trehalose 6-phosphate synthase/phosphatase
VESGLGELRANELMSNLRYFLSDMPLHLLAGNKVIEIKSREVNKGKSAELYIRSGDFDFILAIGDDITDEDMFKVVKDSGITIKVGTHKSGAAYYLNTVEETRHFLGALPARSRLLRTKVFDKVIRFIPPLFRSPEKK